MLATSVAMSLVLFEEEVYKRAELAGRIELLLGPAQVADLRAAVEELLDFEVSRAEGSALVSGRDAGLGDDPEDDLDADSDDVIRLFTSRGLDHWKVGGLVGSGRLPKSGLVFEVLPKVTAGSSDDDLQAARLSLRRMWSFAADLPLNRDENRAEVAAEHMPLHEWLAQRFLGEVEALLRRGIRLQYVEHEDNLSTLRGRLLPLQNIRHNAFAPHRFYCRFEVLSPDRPENRLIRSALAVLVRHSCERNRRRAADLSERMHEVPFSRNVANDFAAWRDDRLMAHYREIRDTCGWILNRRGTAPVRAEQSMRGCFARMHRVFERYVSRWIAQELQAKGEDHRLIDQLSRSAGTTHVRKNLWQWEERGGRWTQMRPDMLVYGDDAQCQMVLDTKWKRHQGDEHISQADIYQMFAYTMHWLPPNAGGVVQKIGLVYPTVEQGGVARRFRFASLERIRGLAVKFKLPRREAAQQRWDEGFDVTRLFE